jgi:hypothetical protein
VREAQQAQQAQQALLGLPPEGELAEPPCCCRALFNATGRVYKDSGHRVCDVCQDARKALHGVTCCRWYWSGPREAFRTTVFVSARAPVEQAPVEQAPEQASVPAEAAPFTPREQEMARRLRWCIDNGFVPANANIWRAPATPQQDQCMGPAGLPWHADGSLRVEGVPCGVAIPLPRDKRVPDEGGEWSWVCTKCACVVRQRPRAYEGGAEPYWWWWCAECRKDIKNMPAEKPRDQRLRKAAAGSGDIRRTWRKA